MRVCLFLYHKRVSIFAKAVHPFRCAHLAFQNFNMERPPTRAIKFAKVDALPRTKHKASDHNSPPMIEEKKRAPHNGNPLSYLIHMVHQYIPHNKDGTKHNCKGDEYPEVDAARLEDGGSCFANMHKHVQLNEYL